MKQVDTDKQENIQKQYEELFNKFKEISTLPIKDWKLYHLLGYFCEKYLEHYTLDYTFSYTTAPMKSSEIFMLKKLNMMLSKDPNIIKNYIDWIFQEKVVQRKRTITSLGFLTMPGNVNEFKFKKLFNKNFSVNRTTLLPDNVITILDEYQLEAKTYGDLLFIKQASKTNTSLEKVITEISTIFDVTKVDGVV